MDFNILLLYIVKNLQTKITKLILNNIFLPEVKGSQSGIIKN